MEKKNEIVIIEYTFVTPSLNNRTNLNLSKYVKQLNHPPLKKNNIEIKYCKYKGSKTFTSKEATIRFILYDDSSSKVSNKIQQIKPYFPIIPLVVLSIDIQKQSSLKKLYNLLYQKCYQKTLELVSII